MTVDSAVHKICYCKLPQAKEPPNRSKDSIGARLRVQGIAQILRARLVQDVGYLAFGAGISQFTLLAATPIILHLYGAEAFGIYATILASASLLSGATGLRIDVIIPFVEARYRALRLVSAVVGLMGIATIGEYILLAGIFTFSGEWQTLLGETAALYIWWVPIIAFGQTIFIVCRVWMLRCSAFRLATLSQLIRVAVFVSCSITFGARLPESKLDIACGILAAQICGDLSGVAFVLWQMRRRARRLLVPLPLWRTLQELRTNRKFIGTSFLVSMLAIINQNIPIWTIGYVFGMQSAGWFSAAQRVATAPVQFSISTVGVVFTQRLRTKRSCGQAISSDVMRLIAILCLALSPIFILLAWLAHSGYVAILGNDWAGAGPTLAAMVFIAFGSVFYAAVESLPLLLRLNRFLIVYHCARLVMTILVSIGAFVGIFRYSSWIYVYAVSEMILYAANAAFVVAYVRRTE